MSLLLPRACVRPHVRLSSLTPTPPMRSGFFGSALPPPTPRRAPPGRVCQRMLPRASAKPPAGSVFETVDHHLKRQQAPRSGAPEEATQWGMRMRNALSRYRHAEAKLAASLAKTPQQRDKDNAQLEPLRRQACTALQVVHNMCDQERGRVPEYVVQSLSQDETWETFQLAMLWRRRELLQPLHWSLPGPVPRTYAGVFDHLKRRLREVMHSDTQDPALRAWAHKVRQTLLAEYIILEDSCAARHDKALRTPAWRLDAIQALDKALAAPAPCHRRVGARLRSLGARPAPLRAAAYLPCRPGAAGAGAGSGLDAGRGLIGLRAPGSGVRAPGSGLRAPGNAAACCCCSP